MTTSRRSRRTHDGPKRAITPWMMALTVLALAGAVLVALAVGDEKQGDAGSGATASGATGDVNAMGMPYVETPGSATGVAEAAGVVVSGAEWALGRVPLDVAFRPTWTLRNTGSGTVEIGEPSPEILEGCCPGPFVLGERSLASGSTTTLSFELAMHPGMDGPHDILVHVPVTAGSSAEILTLGVTGDFRG